MYSTCRLSAICHSIHQRHFFHLIRLFSFFLILNLFIPPTLILSTTYHPPLALLCHIPRTVCVARNSSQQDGEENDIENIRLRTNEYELIATQEGNFILIVLYNDDGHGENEKGRAGPESGGDGENVK